MLVREAKSADTLLLWKFLKTYADDEHAFSERLNQKIVSEDHHIALAISDGVVVGYAWVQDYGSHIRTGHKTARFHDLIVSENMRRNGIGRSLFESVKTWSEQRGVRWLQWQASPKALEFYERLGLKGDPCPQPDFPFFEIEFAD